MGNLVFLAVFAAIVAGFMYAVWGTEDFAYLRIPVFAVFCTVMVYKLVSPQIFYRYYRYRMDEECIEVRCGVIFHSHSLVPVERIHQVQVSKGPILRKFGLATVTVTTAGGTVTLEYLDEPIAEDIAENLNDKIIKMLKARE